jgi:hypothetical protein
VKTELFKDDQVKGNKVDVDVWKSVVQLNGFVDTEEQKQRAETIAWNVRGVRDVRNNLVVKEEMEAVGGPASAPQVGSATDADAEVIFARIMSDPSFHYGRRAALAGKVDTIFSPNAFTLKSVNEVSDRRLLVIANRETVSRLTPEDSVRVEGTLERFDRTSSQQRLARPLNDEEFENWENKPALVLESISSWGQNSR